LNVSDLISFNRSEKRGAKVQLFSISAIVAQKNIFPIKLFPIFAAVFEAIT